MKDCKAELSSGAIVGLVLLVMGAVVVLIVYATIDWKGITNTEVCHASVVMRGSLSTLNSLASGVVPLNCITQNICIGGKCKNDYVSDKKVLDVKIKSKEEIEKLISMELLECWVMMGEGKLSLYSDVLANQGIGTKSPHCFICSRIYFDKEYFNEDKTEDKVKELNLKNLDVLGYMISHKPKGLDESYYSYLGGKVDAGALLNFKIVDVTKDGLKPNEVQTKEIGESQTVTYDVKNPTEPMAIVFSQIFTPTVGDTAKKSALAGGTLSLMAFTGTSKFFGPLIGAKAAAVTAIASALAMVVQAGAVNNNRYLTAGYCGAVSSGESARNGCSMVQIVPYDAKELSARCGYFEGVS